MKYFPILQELFESDILIFAMIGLVISIIIGLLSKSPKKCIIGILISIAVYAVCELVSNFRTNYMLEILLLFLGTIAIGAFAGFLICLLIQLFKSRKKER